MIASLVFFLVLFLVIGVWSARYNRGTRTDYYLASRQVRPWMVGLSAVATNNSGYMFIGIVGFTYTVGLPALWVSAGFVLGDFLISLIAHRELRRAAGATGEVSYAGVLSAWHGTDFVWMRRLVGGLSMLFLLAYASAQFGAGSKMLQVVAGVPAHVGAAAGFVLVTAYCLVGGARASIWTDVAQSFIMLGALLVVVVALLLSLGGVSPALERMSAIPGFLDWSPRVGGSAFSAGLLFAVGWLFAGAGVVGQPHIMSRIMMLDDAGNYPRVRYWYYLWYLLVSGSSSLIGMLARAYLPEAEGFDPELALPTAVTQVLPPLVVGLIVAGVFSATMSTADSQILSCSAALSRDFTRRARFRDRPTIHKAATLLCAGIAFVLALSGNPGIFNLVIFAWGAMGSAFAPLVIVYALGARPGQAAGIAMILTGLAVAVAWRLAGLNAQVYEGLPAMLSAFAVYALITFLARQYRLSPRL